jgi:hypothetical protein
MPNSFYRFQPAWNAGFYPDNQITANLLNALHGNVAAWLPGFYPGTTVSQLVQGVRAQMDNFNVSPYFGNIEIVFTTAPDPPFVEYYIYVRNKSLYAVDNTQDFLVSGLYNPTTNLVINATISPFTVGSYSGTFDASPIAVEAEVDRALQIVEQNGSAFFPMTYSYNATSGIATSGLARGKNWQLDSSGNPVRLPADTLPKQNARTFNIAAQTAEDRYCISLMEKVINYSLTETDETLIQAYFNTFTVPNGWTASFAISIDTYTRVFCLMYRDDRSLLMIGRLDTTWLWQRFINEAGSSDFSYFSAYASTTPLPYLPTISYQWLYGDWYDMEFVNFTDSCYVSPEFYAMPAIPGDNWQFNVPTDSGNLTGLTLASVGLFTQDGQFIQQIGQGSITNACQTQLYASALIPSVASGCYRLGLYSEPYTTCELTFTNSLTGEDYTNWIDAVNAQFESANPFISFSIFGGASSTYYVYPITSGTTTALYISYWVTANIPGMTSTWDEFGIYFSWVVPDLACGNEYSMLNCISQEVGDCLASLWQTSPQPCVCGDSYYLYSLSNIINIDASDCFSTILEFWANDNSIAQGFEYFNGWKQRVRLGLNGGGAKPVIEENLYRQSNGVHKRPQNKQDLSLDLHSDFIDEQTQLALVDATRHPYLVWNNKSIFVKGDIDVATIQDFTTQSSFETLAQVKFSALVQGFQPKNSSCLTC